MDIQYIAESTMALVHYVSGYVTKAERSHVQDIWQEVSDNKSLYSRLWSLGVRCLRTRECGLYEASDMLLGDQLCDNSCTCEATEVEKPQTIEGLEELDPGSENVFMDNLVGNHYPDRPQNLERVCLHDFVANYTANGKHNSGHKTSRELQKPRLVNHYVFNPQTNEDREKYYYSLILLFVPFRDESDLLLAGETAEAFNRLLPTNDNCSAYHSRLQKILALQATVKKIDEAREADVEDKQPEYEEDDDPQVEGEAKAAMQAMQDVVNMHDNAAETITLEERVDMLNADQTRL